MRGRGMRVEDAEGRTFTSTSVSGVGAVSLGHCHPALVSAIEEQASTLVHVSNYYYIEHRGEVAHLVSRLAERDASTRAERAAVAELLRELGCRGRTNAPSSWRDCTPRSAMAAAGPLAPTRTECAPPRAAAPAPHRHARRQLPRAASLANAGRYGAARKQEAFQPLPDGFVRTPINDNQGARVAVPPRATASAPSWWSACRARAAHPCGARVPGRGASPLRRARGALFMCDEIQCGMYRCGTYPFGFQHFGIAPDVVTIAREASPRASPMGM